MNEMIFGGIAVLALAGWTFTNIVLTRAGVPMANTLAILQKIDSLIDRRIAAVVQRVQERAQRATPKIPGSERPEAAHPTIDPLRDLFSQSRETMPLEEQPDSMEVVS